MFILYSSVSKDGSICHSGTSFPNAGNVSFSLNGRFYQNNSIVALEDIGGDNDALLCLTDLTACCRPPYTSGSKSAIGNWFFPNGTRVPSSGSSWDFYRTRGQMMVLLQRRRGGVNGIYRCEIPDAMNVNQFLYIGVYTNNTGESTLATPTRNVPVASEIQTLLFPDT